MTKTKLMVLYKTDIPNSLYFVRFDMSKQESVPTLRDVARRAGVSIATASRVLSNSEDKVRPELREKVLKAAAYLKYVPNAYGQRLKHSVTDTVAVIVPSMQNPFYNQVVFGIEAAAAKAGYDIQIFSSHRSAENERKAINMLLHNRVMLLVIISVDSNSEALDNYIHFGGKVALLEADFTLENAVSFDTNYSFAGSLAAKHLVELGHKRIAFVSTPLTKASRRETLKGIEEVMKKAGLKFSEEDVFLAPREYESDTGMYEFEIGLQLTEKLLKKKRRYTAIIAINDITAFGVIQALSRRGISVPGDISVVGFDNIMYSEMISPPLTTVEMPSVSMGRTACQLLISTRTSHNDDMVDISFRAPYTIKVRKSTAQPANPEK